LKKPVSFIKAIPKLKDAAIIITVRLSEKTILKTEKVTNFFTEVTDFFFFTSRTIKETFSRDFEFREFLHQCFQIGNKSLPLISVTGIIMGLVLTIQSRPVLVVDV
jgi:phospholipid/cholesterol/gamma-HCH transport system permease protein